MSSLPVRAQAKLSEIKAKVEQGYCFYELKCENREFMMLSVREVIEDFLGKELHSTDYGERYDCQAKESKAKSKKLVSELVVSFKRAESIIKNTVESLVKLFS
jgi:hypothetical protein